MTTSGELGRIVDALSSQLDREALELTAESAPCLWRDDCH